jgi:post-segregation antitoxin (ccd killing protein)
MIMSKRVTVNVPDDVAERLSREGNVSAFVTEAVRARMRHETTRAMLEAAGFRFTDEGLAAARRRLEEGRRRMTPDVLAEGRRQLDEMRNGR